MSIAVSIDPDDPTPVYEQLRRQLAGYITTGQLAPGTRLSSVRQLATALDLANGTVARAYRELEESGLVVTRRGGGTTVLDQGTESDEARRVRLTGLARTLVAESRAADLSDADVLALVTQVQRETPPRAGT